MYVTTVMVVVRFLCRSINRSYGLSHMAVSCLRTYVLPLGYLQFSCLTLNLSFRSTHPVSFLPRIDPYPSVSSPTPSSYSQNPALLRLSLPAVTVPGAPSTTHSIRTRSPETPLNSSTPKSSTRNAASLTYRMTDLGQKLTDGTHTPLLPLLYIARENRKQAGRRRLGGRCQSTR